jgi:outer membrane protein assembly factor BamD (BamD/ComL family)
MRYIVVIFILLLAGPLSAAYTLKGGKLLPAEEVATASVQEHYSAALEAYQTKQWNELIKQSHIVLKNFPETSFAHDILFYLGAAQFHLGDYEIANEHLSMYLKQQVALQHFREAIELKFQIAQAFENGARKHIGGIAMMPKWMPATDDAVAIYDEVITALPSDDLAAQSLFGKGKLQEKDDDFAGSVETFQMLIRKFPRHALAPEAYVAIAKVYLLQSQEEYPDDDLRELAELNYRRFMADFPSDHRLATAEAVLAEMHEVYARSFYDIAQFFERTKKPHAALLYYAKIVKAYPGTPSANLSAQRLQELEGDGLDKR